MSEGNFSISNEQYTEALAAAQVHPADKEILDRLFILFDRSGDGIIDYREFLIGLCAIVKGNAKSKLRLAFQIYDVDKTGRISKDEMLSILKYVSKTSSFFGDRPPTEESLVRLLDNIYDVMDDSAGDATYNIYLKPITEDVLMEDFVKQVSPTTKDLNPLTFLQSETSVKLQKDVIDD